MDKTELQTLYDNNKDREKGSYTDSSWSAFEEALENARKVLEDVDATAEDVSEAKDNLALAIDGLVGTDLYLLGNAYDSDEIINLKDVLAIQKHVASKDQLKGKALKAADTNLDKVVTINDALLTQKYVAKLLPSDTLIGTYLSY